MRTIQHRIGNLAIIINVNSDWSGDAYIKICRWEPWIQERVDRYVGGRTLPPIAARGLLAGRYVPRRPAFYVPEAPELDAPSLEEWGAVVAVAVYASTKARVAAALESVGVPGSEGEAKRCG